MREEGGSFGDGKPIAFFAPSAMHTSDDLARNFGKTQSMIEWMQVRAAAFEWGAGWATPTPQY